MQSVQAGMWDPRPPFKQHASPLTPQPHLSHPRLSHVSAPAKRITFYKSGDSQFGGIKMAVHKRSFKCFDALLDDLSQKVPLPFGVRTVTTPRGTHTIRHIEQLQDGGCYLCSDRRHAKPINMEIANKRPEVWSHHSRRPHRPDSTSATPPGHVPYRQRRLLLVKNTEPGVRRSIVLSRRVTRSLRAFLEEASDVMQFHVRKLYTVEGRKIDNVQSLMTCPNVLVCVGREAFSPLLVNYIRKSSDEKLPGLGPRTPGNGARSSPHGAQSRASEHSEGQDSKKNTVNFGLETKKSIIHPRSDSSNRSARFSMSSEKSYGISALSQGRPAIMNDDIEKRVVVNKDGSLSVEMKVRFRLHSDETLQWSTQIKKSPSLTNDSCSINQGQPHYLQQGQSESCSDPDCNSFDPEAVDYSAQCAMDANRCQCCYRHEQQYDLWENPAHCHQQPVPPHHTTNQSHTIMRHTHSSSSSSSCNSTRVVRCRARLTNCEDGSEHSQIVQEEMCVTEQHIVEQEVCTVSQCCSRSEVVTVDSSLQPQSGKSGEDEEERPMSAVSASSHVLQELKEDDDDEELPPSASRCGHSNEQSPSPEVRIDDKPASNASANQKQNGGDEEEGSACQCLSTSGAEATERASTSKSKASRVSCKSTQEMTDNEVEEVKRVVSGLSASSHQSVTSVCPNCGGWKLKAASECNSRASHRSNNLSPRPATSNSAKDEDADNGDADDNGSDVSIQSNKSNLTNYGRASAISNAGECRAPSATSKTGEDDAKDIRSPSATSGTSHRSNKSHKSACKDAEIIENTSPSAISAKSEKSNCNAGEEAEMENTSERAVSAMSAKSSASGKTNASHKSSINVTPPSTAEEDEEIRAPSAVSVKSNATAKESRPASAKSTKSTKSNVDEMSSPNENVEEETRAPSTLSVKSNLSAKESRPASAISAKSVKSHVYEKSSQNENVQEETRVASVLSVKSNVSAKESRPASAISVKSAKSHVSEKYTQNKNVEEEIRAASAMSEKSHLSAKESRPASSISVKSHVSEKSSQNENVEEETRATSSMSEKSNTSAKESRPASAISVKSARSHVSEKSSKNENVEEETRAASVVSEKSCASRPTSAISIKSTKSHVSERSPQNENVEEETKAASVMSEKSSASAKESRPASAISVKSTKSHLSEKSSQNENVEEETRAISTMSEKSNASAKESRPASAISVKSAKSHVSENLSQDEIQNVEEETRAVSIHSEKSNATAEESRPASAKSSKSTKSRVSEKTSQNENVEEDTRAASAISVKSNVSAKQSRPASAKSTKSNVEIQNVEEETRAASTLSVKSHLSAKESRPTSVISVKSTKSHVSEKSSQKENVEGETKAASAFSAKSNKSNKTGPRSMSPRPNAEKDEEDRGGSALSNKSRKSNISAKSNCNGNVQNGEEDEEKAEVRAASAISGKSTLSVKSSHANKSLRLASPPKEQDTEGDRTTSAMSGKTHMSAVSAKSKRSNQTEISANVNEDDDSKSERVTSAMSAKSSKSRKSNVVTIKMPEVVYADERPASSASAKTENSNMSSISKPKEDDGVENEDANESIVEDQAPKSRASNRTLSPRRKQELMPENGEPRGSSALSVRSGKTVKSSKSKCSCGKKEEQDVKEVDDNREESEVAASISSSKRRDLDENDQPLSPDSFASVSLVLPEDQESESGESGVSSQRNTKCKSKTTPEVSKSAEDVEEEEHIEPSHPPAIDIPTIKTPGGGENDEDASNEKTRVASSCSTKSTHSVKSTKKSSCSSCGKLTAHVNGTESPVASVKSFSTTRTGQLTAPDNRTASAMSSVSGKSQRKSPDCDHLEANDTNQEGIRTASEAKGEDEKINRAKSKSPCRLRPKSAASNQSGAKTSVQSVKSSHNKEDTAKSSSPNPQNGSRPASKGDTCSESILSHSLSAADLLKEVMAAAPPQSPRSRVSKASNKSTKSQRSKKEAERELTPSCLPNASPIEVVSDWLRSIPANMLAVGDEPNEEDTEVVEKCGEDMEAENGGGGGGDDEEVKGKDEEKAEEIEEEEEGPKEDPVEKFEIHPKPLVNESSVPKNWHSSAAVMKVLLSSSLGRCRSMPEVSPVYGRRLSTSAKELLDCLTQLQLIEPSVNLDNSVHKDQRPQFEDIISILQSLWLSEPREIVDPKDPSGTDQVSPPRSSSGVGMSSGSGGSGKDNVNQEDNPKHDEEVGQEEAKTDTVEEGPESLDSPKATENLSSLDKNSKSNTDNELDTQEGSSSGSPPTVLRAPLTKLQSQDPDPVWVLQLLKKLEKQFINHYVNAMAEFKVKWDLEDSLILDKMIEELRDEVSQRIQSSVEREVKKIQSRAGKGGRVPRPPPGSNLSRESTMTEKRRRLLKVMKNQSVKTGDSLSDEELTGEFSDQRSDDEYCPCEACVRKKMAARPVKTNPNAIEAPVQKEFDLLKILQFKKSPTPVAAKVETMPKEAKEVVEEEEGRNLEVVQEEEEDEDSKVEVKADEHAEEEEEGAEKECQCDCSRDEDDEESEESDKDTVKEKSSHAETIDEASGETDTAEQTAENEETTGAEEAERGEEDTAEGESEKASTEEKTSEQEGMPGVCVTEGEDADVEDSGTEEKSEEEKESEATEHKEDPVEENTTQDDELKPDKKDDISLLHQFTRTSVESQPGSLEDVDDAPNVNNIEVPKLASPGGTSQRRSRSPARVKRRKAKDSDSDTDDI